MSGRSRSRFGALFLVVLLACVGCATTRQSAAELNAGLAWVVPAERSQGWPLATEDAVRLERVPAVVIAWVPSPAGQGEAPYRATRAARESWIAAIEDKLDRSGLVTRAEGSPPDTFDDGVTVTALQTLGTDRQADVIVLFGLDAAERRYHVSWPTRPVYVVDVIEVQTTARAVGVTPAGRPVFTETQTGFDEGPTRFEDEVEQASGRAALNALADAIVRRLSQISPGKGSR